MGKVYGLFFGAHGHSTTLIVDGKIQYAVEDERITRIKTGKAWWHCPSDSLNAIEQASKIKLEDADSIVIGDPTMLLTTYEGADQCMKDYRNRLYNLKDKITFFPHHTSHAYSSYYNSGFTEKTLVIVYDGMGYEKEFATIWLAENGKMTKVHSLNYHEYGSLTSLWFEACSFYNWVPTKDEGKIMGMAGHGKYDDYLYNTFKSCATYSGNLQFYPASNLPVCSFVYSQLRKEGYFSTQEKKQDFAYNLQKYTEDTFLKYLKDITSLYPDYRNLAVAGGIFANVKLNQVINESGLFDQMFICPAMGDEGISLGAAIKGAIDLGDWKGVKKLENAFLGLEYTQEEIDSYASTLPVESQPLNYKTVGRLIHEGNIIALFNGRFEFGPRALGARSVMVRPTDAETHEVLNTRLERHEIMPFAPFVMAEYADIVFDVPQSEHAAEFMTMCYTVRKEWTDKIPAVIHRVDNTGRPQIVYKHKNPVFWNVLNEYNKISGIPVMLNTSFNGHGEPIINAPDQAFNHLIKGTIDYLIAGNKIYKKK